MNYTFDKAISKEVLCNYLRRSATVSLERAFVIKPQDDHVKTYILNTGVKYLCRFATCWEPSMKDIGAYPDHKTFLASMHAIDPELVFEACVFECISGEVNEIPIPAYVFEAFGLEAEKRCFSFDQMRYESGKFLHIWGEGTAVPDMTRIETQMFFYFRACSYLDLGYEALHMGQVHLIGENDHGWVCWTKVLNMIRAYAKEHARRHFVFLNAHTHGILDADGKLMFDFHMYPARPVAVGDEEQIATEERPQQAIFKIGHGSSIYGKSMGGMTHSGWECDSLPCLVELDNYGYVQEKLNIPDPNDWMCWGMDEISWFANQPAHYRKYFLQYAYDFVKNEVSGDCFFAMPGQRVATYFDENKNPIAHQYYAYDPKNHPLGNGDELLIKQIWEQDK